VIETDETNNTLCSTTTVTVPKPDLVVSALSTTATTVKAVGSVLVSNTIKNQGGWRAGWSVVAFHLPTNQTYGDGDDIASVTTRLIASLGINLTSPAPTYVKIPASTTPGSYFVCVMVDANNTVTEMDETNNSRCTTTPLTITP